MFFQRSALRKKTHHETYYGQEASLLFRSDYLTPHLVPALQDKVSLIHELYTSLRQVFNTDEKFEAEVCHVECQGEFNLISAYLQQGSLKGFFSLITDEKLSLHQQVYRLTKTLFHCVPVRPFHTHIQKTSFPKKLKDHITRVQCAEHLSCIVPDTVENSGILMHSVNYPLGENVKKASGITVLFGYQYQ